MMPTRNDSSLLTIPVMLMVLTMMKVLMVLTMLTHVINTPLNNLL